MSNGIIHKLKGDRVIWGIVILMMISSLIIVYSAISNLAWRSSDGGNVFRLILKHGVFIFASFMTIFFVHKVPSRFFNIATLLLPIGIGLLVYTLMQGKTIDGANASRWVSLPFLGVSIQSSTVASILLFIHVARYLSKVQEHKPKFKETILPLWLPVIAVAGLVLPANFSTAALIVVNVGLLLLIGRYPLKHLALMFLVGVMFLTLFIGLAVKFPSAFPNRVNTWASRIESFQNGGINDEQYQVQSAKVAIALGGVLGKGPGKSVQKNHLPQSSSDFIFAIVIEEFGIIGGVMLIALYMVLLLRIVIVSSKAKNVFSSLLVLALGLPIITQALINMAVATGLFPVTGQPLPLISSGGTSILLIGFALGAILSVSRESQEALVNESNTDDIVEPINQQDGLKAAL